MIPFDIIAFNLSFARKVVPKVPKFEMSPTLKKAAINYIKALVFEHQGLKVTARTITIEHHKEIVSIYAIGKNYDYSETIAEYNSTLQVWAINPNI
jgi:hypothetical protein